MYETKKCDNDFSRTSQYENHQHSGSPANESVPRRTRWAVTMGTQCRNVAHNTMQHFTTGVAVSGGTQPPKMLTKNKWK